MVFAPCIACEDDAPLATQVTLTKYTATIIEKNINLMIDSSTSFAGRAKMDRSISAKVSTIAPRPLAKKQMSCHREKFSELKVQRSRGFITLEAPSTKSETTVTVSSPRQSQAISAASPNLSCLINENESQFGISFDDLEDNPLLGSPMEKHLTRSCSAKSSK